MKKLSVVIPCYNEAESLPGLIKEIEKTIRRDDIEIILVDDGSRDGSAKILKELSGSFSRFRVITNETNQGYGGAILEGLKNAEGEYIGWMHGDLQTSFDDVLTALKTIESAGEPKNIYVKGTRKGRPFFDEIFTFSMGIFESLLLNRWLFDINAQPNIFHRSFFDSWTNAPRDFSLDLYAMYTARIQNLNIIRIPVVFPPRKFGESHWNTGFRAKLKFIKRTISFSLELEKRVSSFRKITFLKYLTAGGIGGLVHLSLLFLFTDIFSIHYLISTALALFIVFWLSFFMQKYWTFIEKSKERFWRQSVHYFAMHSIAFAGNIALMYLFVDIFGIWYMLSQVIVSLGISMVTFTVNKKVIFASQ